MISGEPQTCAGSATNVLPPAINAAASSRWTLREVGSLSRYSTEKLANPLSVKGRPMLPAIWVASPSPSKYCPVLNSKEPPSESSLSAKLITPAIASEPYCAAAPSRNTSTCLSATDGIVEISGPCAPSEIWPPKKVITAERWRRLPLTSINVWSGARPRKLAGRTNVDASLIGWSLTLNEGTAACIIVVISVEPWLLNSSALIISTGTAESPIERGATRDPTTAIFSTDASAFCDWLSWASAGADTMTPAVAVAAIILRILTANFDWLAIIFWRSHYVYLYVYFYACFLARLLTRNIS